MPKQQGIYPTAKATITALLAKPVAAAADAAEGKLRDNLGQTSGGQGVKYNNLPNTSSASGQDPIKQSGRLQGMVDSEKVTDTMHRVGMFPKNSDEAGQARALEYGYAPGGLAERAYLQRWSEDPETHRLMLTAAQKAGEGR